MLGGHVSAIVRLEAWGPGLRGPRSGAHAVGGRSAVRRGSVFAVGVPGLVRQARGTRYAVWRGSVFAVGVPGLVRQARGTRSGGDRGARLVSVVA